MDLDIQGRSIASAIVDLRPHSHSHKEIQKEQRLDKTGAYRALVVDIKEGDHHKDKRKEGGSTMFPDTWSTEDVARAIVKVANSDPVKSDEKRKSNTHIEEVNGLRVRVITDQKTGKVNYRQPKEEKIVGSKNRLFMKKSVMR